MTGYDGIDVSPSQQAWGQGISGLSSALSQIGNHGPARGGGYGNFSPAWAQARGQFGNLNEGGYLPAQQQQQQQRPMMPPSPQQARPMQGTLGQPMMGPQQLMPQQMGQLFQNYNQLQNPGLLPSRPMFY